jgi:hypothetical protein
MPGGGLLWRQAPVPARRARGARDPNPGWEGAAKLGRGGQSLPVVGRGLDLPGTTRLKLPGGCRRLHRRHRCYRGGGHRPRPPGLVCPAPRRPTKAPTSQLGSERVARNAFPRCGDSVTARSTGMKRGEPTKGRADWRLRGGLSVARPLSARYRIGQRRFAWRARPTLARRPLRWSRSSSSSIDLISRRRSVISGSPPTSSWANCAIVSAS